MSQCILVFTALDYDGNKYGDYRFPFWANFLGWILTFSSIILVPALAILKISREEGTLTESVSLLLKCSSEWRPKGSPAKKNVENMTLKELESGAPTEGESSNLL